MKAPVSAIIDKDSFAGKTVLIMGLGRFGGGLDAARFAVANGAGVIVTDSAPPRKLARSIEQLQRLGDIGLHLGSHDPADFERADIVIANPAVHPDNEFLEIARRSGGLITSQIAIFLQLCPAASIGITGANGKSTTAALTAHILEKAKAATRNREAKNVIASAAKQSQTTRCAEKAPSGAIRLPHGGVSPPRPLRPEPQGLAGRYENVWLSGNIGNRPLLTTIDQISPRDLIVLELSSFQLEQLGAVKMAPSVSLLTNLTPNHLDRHGTFEAYCAAKENIFKFQKLDKACPAVSIFNAEDQIASEWFDKYRSEPGRTCIKFSAEDIPAPMRASFPLPGRANLSNLAAAVAIARCFALPDDAITDSLPGFKTLPHRLEPVAEINGVRWYNDSIATTPDSAIAALDAFDSPPIIIAGGYDKNLPFDELGRKIAATAKAAILLGRTAPKIADAIQKARIENRQARIETVESLAQAVRLAARLAVPGDIVLLSPACASYDMFDNFQQRGGEFARLVNDLSSHQPQH